MVLVVDGGLGFASEVVAIEVFKIEPKLLAPKLPVGGPNLPREVLVTLDPLDPLNSLEVEVPTLVPVYRGTLPAELPHQFDPNSPPPVPIGVEEDGCEPKTLDFTVGLPNVEESETLVVGALLLLKGDGHDQAPVVVGYAALVVAGRDCAGPMADDLERSRVV